MSTDGQITDSVRPYAPRWSLQHQNLRWPRRESRHTMGHSGLSRRRASRPALKETGRQAAYCKHTAGPGSPSRFTRTVTIVTAAGHHSYKHIPCIHWGGCAMGRFDLASALTIDYRSGLCFYGQWSPPIVQSTVHLYTVKLKPSGATWLTRRHDVQVPTIKYEFNKQNFIDRSLFNYVLFFVILSCTTCRQQFLFYSVNMADCVM